MTYCNEDLLVRMFGQKGILYDTSRHNTAFTLRLLYGFFLPLLLILFFVYFWGRGCKGRGQNWRYKRVGLGCMIWYSQRIVSKINSKRICCNCINSWWLNITLMGKRRLEGGTFEMGVRAGLLCITEESNQPCQRWEQLFLRPHGPWQDQHLAVWGQIRRGVRLFLELSWAVLLEKQGIETRQATATGMCNFGADVHSGLPERTRL